MPTAAAIGAVGAIGSAGLGVAGSLIGSGQQAGALSSAITAIQGMFKQAKDALSPYYTAGTDVLPTIKSLITPGSNQTATLAQLPGFQFATDWGTKAIQNLGTTTGLGGNTLTAGANFATGLASQNWLNYLGPLLSVLTTGENAAGALGGTASNFAGTLGSTTGQLGQARAAGTLGAFNAGATGLTGGSNAITNAMLLSRLFPNNPVGAPSAPNPGIYSTPSFPLVPNQPFQTAG